MGFDEVFQRAAGAMVYFEGVTGDGDAAAGAGFHVGGGRVVTAGHVVADMVEWRIWRDDPTTPELDSIEVHYSSVVGDPSCDLAIVQTDLDGVPLEVLDPRTALPQPQQDVLLLGYPRIPFTTGPILSSARDHITLVIPARKDILGTHSLILARAQPPGYSGGPAILETGLVVGVVSIGRQLDTGAELTSCVACTHLVALMGRDPDAAGLTPAT